jgi:hypothetical protein
MKVIITQVLHADAEVTVIDAATYIFKVEIKGPSFKTSMFPSIFVGPEETVPGPTMTTAMLGALQQALSDVFTEFARQASAELSSEVPSQGEAKA